MRLGQTSFIHFVSRLTAAIIGFFGTLYIARILGSEPLGVYKLAVGLVSWLAIAGRIGISGAITKRVSEGEQQGEYAVAGVLVIALLFSVIAGGIVVFRPYVNQYIGYQATGFIMIILLLVLGDGIVGSLLTGLHLVHIRGILSPIKTTGRSLFQIIAVFVGLQTAGLFLGHIGAFVLVTMIGLYFVYRNLPEMGIPGKKHYKNLFDYAKFSWLGSLQARMFNYTDIIVLGFFVPSSLIGIYAIAWNIAQFLILFSGSLKSTLFPEMSELSAEQNPQAVSDIVVQALTYGGLFLIPGVFGGALLGERILRIYGPEFTQGATILTILIVANLFMGYQNQLLNTLSAIDRPDLAFRVNAVFVVGNVSLNVVLIILYGWVGAAVATTTSVAISLVLAYRHVAAIIDFSFPTGEIAKQWFAAIVMVGVVYGGLALENTYRLLRHNVATVLLFVGLGASVYFLILLKLSKQFRHTVKRNFPFELPWW